MSEKYLYAFDASLDCSGLTIFNLTTMEHVLTCSFPMKKTVEKSEKLRTLEIELMKLFKKYTPWEFAMESVFISVSGTNQFAQANRFKASESLFNVHGMIYTRAYPCPIYLYSPTNIKKIVAGHGQADKSKVAQSIKNKYPHMKFNNSDESDSYAVCVTHLVSKHEFEWVREPVTKEDVKPKKTTRSKSTRQTKQSKSNTK